MKMTRVRTGVGIMMWVLLLAPMVAGAEEARAQQPLAPVASTAGSAATGPDASRVSGCCRNTPPVIVATRVPAGTIHVDGLADEEAWSGASVATDFGQFEPDEGSPSTERTEARVLYGEDALYVFMRAWDSEPDQIVGQLTRRDQSSYSDQLGVVVDSYFDRRTAFHFAVNPVGVKHDIYRYDDTGEDQGWDAVWDVETRRHADGWSAEFRIPFSQLRFREAADQTWGINFTREIARRQETAVWAPMTRSDAAIVSRFGELRGLRDLAAPNRIEIVPYSLASLQRAPGDEANPYYSANSGFGTAGLDLKYGVTSNLTLDVTVNPDFGQVEADPAQVNLGAFETFLPERRPFFVEGSSIFNFPIALGDGDGAGESLFYSRRIGRAPQGSVPSADGFVDMDDKTTILGAWKLSGKTSGGWSIGAMHALTAGEQARVTTPTGEEFQEPVEPFSNYGVVRVQKDFRDGRSAVGVIGTGLIRDSGVSDQLGLRSSAFSAGVDFRHRFYDERWELSSYVIGSHVRGSEEAIALTQRSPARYFQRPDAEHTEYRPDRTSLSGGSANVGISKISGGYWRVGTGVQTRTPGFEVNDVGFMNSADYTTHWGWLGYHHSDPQGPFRNWNVNLNAWHNWNWDGDRTGTGGNVNVNVQWKNFWHAYGGVNRDLEAWSAGLLRGGPLMRREAQTNWWSGMGTDSRKAVQLNLNASGNVRAESDSWRIGFFPNLRIRPSSRATLNLGGFYNRNVDDRQWVTRAEADGAHYLFGRLDQTTVGVTARVDFAFTPTLSLQLYAQPFVSAGAYGSFREVADPTAAHYADRFAAIATRSEGGRHRVDLDADGTDESFGDPDFNIRQFRSNVVLRWEYLPGSALFLVWSQGRDDFVGQGRFDFRDDVRDLFDVPSDDVFMIKLSYWMSR